MHIKRYRCTPLAPFAGRSNPKSFRCDCAVCADASQRLNTMSRHVPVPPLKKRSATPWISCPLHCCTRRLLIFLLYCKLLPQITELYRSFQARTSAIFISSFIRFLSVSFLQYCSRTSISWLASRQLLSTLYTLNFYKRVRSHSIFLFTAVKFWIHILYRSFFLRTSSFDHCWFLNILTLDLSPKVFTCGPWSSKATRALCEVFLDHAFFKNWIFCIWQWATLFHMSINDIQ